MICPYCQTAVHLEPEDSLLFRHQDTAYGVYEALCPGCEQTCIYLMQGSNIARYDHYSELLNPAFVRFLFPGDEAVRTLPAEVPEPYRTDFLEAVAVVRLSSRASAALSRRCLQRLVKEHFGIDKHSLAQEIDALIRARLLPSHIADAVDAIRTIGNLAAHPLKDRDTGQVVEVEPGEAEWLLEVLDLLFDFVFVAPATLEARKHRLNARLAALGLPPMKDALSS